MRVRVVNGTIEVVQGDITEMLVDAIVNLANNHLGMGGGVAGAIKAKGGEEIEQEAVRQGPVKIGRAVVTSAGRLKAKHVIHAAVMGQDLKASESNIRTATRNSLQQAEEKGVESLAFPAIGAGTGRLSPHLCARIMHEEAIAFLQEAQTLRQIFFVLPDRRMCDLFKEQLEAIFSSREK
ncbi:MAG: macro domain-containing protein [bacterium]